jgi:hypothetical protein
MSGSRREGDEISLNAGTHLFPLVASDPNAAGPAARPRDRSVTILKADWYASGIRPCAFLVS